MAVVWLSLWLSARMPLVVVALALAAAGAAVAAWSAHAAHAAAARIPAIVAMLAAWSVGVMVAFAGALGALPRDVEHGVLGLARARGLSLNEYVVGRTAGLVAAIGLAVIGPTLVAAMFAWAPGRPVVPSVRGAVAALAYAFAFSATLGPVAVAALASGSRIAGYAAFLAVLVLPEIVAAPMLRAFGPGSSWHELTSIPAALDALRAGVEGGPFAPAGRATVLLLAVILASLAVARARTTGHLTRAARGSLAP